MSLAPLRERAASGLAFLHAPDWLQHKLLELTNGSETTLHSHAAVPVINNIQKGTTTLTGTATSNTTTITAVDVSKAFIVHNGHDRNTLNGTTPEEFDASVELTDTTTVTVRRGAGTAGDSLVVYWTVVEFS